MTSPERDQIFISYSHGDEPHWLQDLQTHLNPHLRNVSITAWSDQQIKPGSKWFDEIKDALAKTKVAVLLVTPKFLDSDFIHDHELTPLLRDAEAGGVRILWIPVRASAYKESQLQRYQAAIDPAKPLAEMTAKRDSAWVRICEEIARAIREEVGHAPQPNAEDSAGPGKPVFGVLHPEPQHARHALQDELQRLETDGSLHDSMTASLLKETMKKMSEESILQLAAEYDPDDPDDPTRIPTAIQLSDEYLVRVHLSAGAPDWQANIAQAATPLLVGMARSLERSPHTQALLMRLCNSVAGSLRLEIVWPSGPEQFNELSNAIYHACINAKELDNDSVLCELRRLTVVGPR